MRQSTANEPNSFPAFSGRYSLQKTIPAGATQSTQERIVKRSTPRAGPFQWQAYWDEALPRTSPCAYPRHKMLLVPSWCLSIQKIYQKCSRHCQFSPIKKLRGHWKTQEPSCLAALVHPPKGRVQAPKVFPYFPGLPGFFRTCNL